MGTHRTMFVQPYGQIGGAERYLETLLGLLPASAVDRIICLQRGDFPTLLRDAGYPVELLETGPSPRDIVVAGLRLRRVLRRHPPDVIHANGLKGALVAGLASCGTGIPVVWVKHDFSWDGRVGRLGGRLSTRVIGVSDAVTASLGAGVRRRKVRTVYNGTEVPDVDRAAARRELRAAIGAPDSASVVTLVGRLHPVKGHLDLLAITRSLADRFAGLRIAFVGGDDPNNLDHARLLRDRCRELELDGIVHFLGFRDDVTTLVAGSDIVAVPSGTDERGMGREAFPLAALEALAVRVPVVAYADGGVPELVGDCGFLVPPGDLDGFGAAVGMILADPDSAARVAGRGPERVRTLFGLDTMLARTLAVYDEAVRQP